MNFAAISKNEKFWEIIYANVLAQDKEKEQTPHTTELRENPVSASAPGRKMHPAGVAI